MEVVHGLRVSEGPICAAVAPKDLLCFGTARSPTAGSSELDVSLWSWDGSSDGKNFYDSNHSKQRPVRSPSFWVQVDYLRAALEILSHRPEFFTQNNRSLPSLVLMRPPPRTLCTGRVDLSMTMEKRVVCQFPCPILVCRGSDLPI